MSAMEPAGEVAYTLLRFGAELAGRGLAGTRWAEADLALLGIGMVDHLGRAVDVGVVREARQPGAPVLVLHPGEREEEGRAQVGTELSW